MPQVVHEPVYHVPGRPAVLICVVNATLVYTYYGNMVIITVWGKLKGSINTVQHQHRI